MTDGTDERSTATSTRGPIRTMLLLAAMGLSCAARPVMPPAPPALPAPVTSGSAGAASEPVATRVLWTSQRADVGDARLERVFSTEGDFDAWWRVATGGMVAAPEVDFASHVVVAVSPGRAPNACHGVEIVRARREGTTLIVEVGRRSPAAGATCAQVIVHPTVVAAVARPAGTVRFEWSDLEPALP